MGSMSQAFNDEVAKAEAEFSTASKPLEGNEIGGALIGGGPGSISSSQDNVATQSR